MAENRKRFAKIGEAAGFVVTSAAGVFVQLNTQWLGEHMRVVFCLYGGAIFLAALFVSQTDWMKRLLGEPLQNSPESVAPARANAIVSPAISGNSIHQTFNGVTLSGSPVESTAKDSKPSANPVFIHFDWKFKVMKLVDRRGTLIQSYGRNGWTCLVAEISVAVPPKGEHGQQHDVVGHVRILGNENELNVSRSHWVGKASQDVTLDIGESETLVLFGHEGEEWVGFNNPYSTLVLNSDFGPTVLAIDNPRRMKIDGEIRVEVSLIAPYSKQTLDRKNVRLTVKDSKWLPEVIG